MTTRVIAVNGWPHAGRRRPSRPLSRQEESRRHRQTQTPFSCRPCSRSAASRNSFASPRDTSNRVYSPSCSCPNHALTHARAPRQHGAAPGHSPCGRRPLARRANAADTAAHEVPRRRVAFAEPTSRWSVIQYFLPTPQSWPGSISFHRPVSTLSSTVDLAIRRWLSSVSLRATAAWSNSRCESATVYRIAAELLFRAADRVDQCP